MSTVTIANNAVIAKLVDADREVKLLVSALLSYQVDGAEHTSTFQSGRWDGRSSFLDFNRGTFPAGFADRVHAHLVKKGYKVLRARKPLPAPLGPENPVVDEFGDDPRYDYQPEVMRRLVRYGQIIAQVATGGGKSRIAKMCAVRIGRPTLFLTTRGILMYQMKDSFEGLGKAVGVLGDSEWSPRRGINVGMVQTLVARLREATIESEVEAFLVKEREEEAKFNKALTLARKMGGTGKLPAFKRKTNREIVELVKPRVETQQRRREETIKVLEMFELVILEEAHEASGNSYFEIMRNCRNAYYRLALTATPFMKDSEESNMRLMACSGPIAIKVSEKLLIDRGILAKPYFKFVTQFDRPAKLYRTSAWKVAYKAGVSENERRNRAVVYEAERAAKLGMPVMVLVQHKAHGKLLETMLKERGVRAAFIFGEHSQEERRRYLGWLKDGKIDTLIGSTILDVGVDVPAVGMVILAGGGKAEVAMRQRIGRGLRAKKGGPNVCLVVDFHDEWNQHTKNHAVARFNIVKNTEGFGENILPAGRDFDFAGLGLLRGAA